MPPKHPTIRRAHFGFLVFAVLQQALLAVVGAFFPDGWTSSAYSLALSIMPPWGYAIVWALNCALGLWIVVRIKNKSHPPITFGPILIFNVVFTIVQIIFAWSIFWLTFTGSRGAIAGAIQWAGLGLVSWLWVRHIDED